MSDEDGARDGSGVSSGDAGGPGPAPSPDAGAPDPADGDSADDGDGGGKEGPGIQRDDSAADDVEDGEWRFSLEDLPADGDDESEGEGIAGAFGPSKDIEPGDIDRESVLFVVLGACIAIVGLYLMFP
jgi:hypothetical protein